MPYNKPYKPPVEKPEPNPSVEETPPPEETECSCGKSFASEKSLKGHMTRTGHV